MSTLPFLRTRLAVPIFLGLALALLTGIFPAVASDKPPEFKVPEPMEFVVNIGRSIDDARILRIAIVLEYANDEISRHFSGHRPKLMHQILLVLSQQASEWLLSKQGKIELKQQIVRKINDAFRETEKTGVKDALFTDFLVQ